MTATFAEAYNDILDRFQTTWNPTGFVAELQNMPPPTPVIGEPWARLIVQHTGQQQSMMAAQFCDRIGTITVEIYVPKDEGLNRGYDLSRLIVQAFQGIPTPKNVWFRNARLNEIGLSTDWFQINVLIDFEYYAVAGASAPVLLNFTQWSQTDRIPGNWVFSNNDRSFQSPDNAAGGLRAIHSNNVGKFYWELFYAGANASGQNFPDALGIGVARSDQPLTGSPNINPPFAFMNTPSGFVPGVTRVSVALDLDVGAVWTAANGVWDNGATQAEIEAGITTNATGTGLTGSYFPYFQDGGTLESYWWDANFGQSAFTYPVPTGFLPGFGMIG